MIGKQCRTIQGWTRITLTDDEVKQIEKDLLNRNSVSFVACVNKAREIADKFIEMENSDENILAIAKALFDKQARLGIIPDFAFNDPLSVSLNE